MLQDASFCHICDQIILISAFLKQQVVWYSQQSYCQSNTDQNRSPNSNKNSSPTLLDFLQNDNTKSSSRVNGQKVQPQFMYMQFDKKYERQFEQFLEYQLQKQKFLIQQQQLKVQRRVKYIEKHKSPKTVFNFYGVDIEVIYQNFQTFKANCLVLPTQNMSFNSISKLTSNRKLVTEIIQKCEQKMLKMVQQNQQIFTLFSKYSFRQHNYDYVYIVKKPHLRSNIQYSKKKLKDFVLGVFRRFCSYRTSKTVAFADFFWPGLSSNDKCVVFFWSILNAIYEQLCKKFISLKTVTICCSTQSSYFQFTYKLRELSDYYVTNGNIPLYSQN